MAAHLLHYSAYSAFAGAILSFPTTGIALQLLDWLRGKSNIFIIYHKNTGQENQISSWNKLFTHFQATISASHELYMFSTFLQMEEQNVFVAGS